MRKIVLVIVICIEAILLSACSCSITVDAFCYSADSSDYITLVELIDFDDETAAHFKTIENINKVLPDTIALLGQDGLNCYLDLDQFEVGDTLILNMRFHPNGVQNVFNSNTYYWGIDGCSRHFLHYSEGRVLGNIDGMATEMEYTEFKDGILDCYDFDTSNDEVGVKEVLVYPNPFHGSFQVQVDNAEIQRIDLFDLRGQKIKLNSFQSRNTWSIELEEKNNGIYLLVVSTSKGILRKKLLLVNEG